MAQLMNAFTQKPEKGMIDLRISTGSVLSCMVDTSSAGGLVPGQSVKLVNVAGGIPNVVECAANSDDVFGFVTYDIKNASLPAGSAVEIAFNIGTVMFMEASAAIVPYAKVGVVISGSKVVTATTGLRVVGFALDKAAASGDLIRVVIQLPGAIV